MPVRALTAGLAMPGVRRDPRPPARQRPRTVAAMPPPARPCRPRPELPPLNVAEHRAASIRDVRDVAFRREVVRVRVASDEHLRPLLMQRHPPELAFLAAGMLRAGHQDRPVAGVICAAELDELPIPLMRAATRVRLRVVQPPRPELMPDEAATLHRPVIADQRRVRL